MIETKYSGAPWIGSIPIDWNILRFKDKFENKKEIAGNNSVKYERLALTLNGVVKRSKSDDDGLQPKAFDTYQILRKNDFVFKMIDLQNISTSRVGLSQYTGLVSPAYIRFSPKEENLVTKYTYYFLMSMYYNCVFNNLGGDGVRSALNSSDMGSLMIPWPNRLEQIRIADFLDDKLSKIDALITNQQQQIEKLKQYKQSLITEVVTKGLNKNVAMKDSGVDWIGEVPREWKLEKIKYVAIIRDEKYEGGDYEYIALENVESLSGRYVKTDSTYDLEGTKLAYSGDVIFGKLRPYLGKALSIDHEYCVSTEFAVFSPKKLTSEYLKYVLLSYGFIEIINASTYGTKMPRANIDFIKNVIVPIPTKKEQDDIVAEAIRIDNSLQRLIDIKLSKIEKLNQYKKSLIYEYVTGKKSVLLHD